MFSKRFSAVLLLVLVVALEACSDNNKASKSSIQNTKEIDTSEQKTDTISAEIVKEVKKEKDTFRLTTKNAVDFFFNYEKTITENKVRLKTKYGNIDIKLFENTPYHRANFIYLTKKKYFDSTYFYRAVPNFVIQGGNTDNYKTSKKRNEIGHYLLPPDNFKGHSHRRGIVSMPSSNIDNPHKFASPYEFFIVVQNPGAFHLDGEYTAFGKVIAGMDVVDTISKLRTDEREWPFENVIMMAEILE
ncbi:hypothetical protein NBRC110019_06700 [Neptunitalea chrysea]|uniref:Peptidyl-prolyl cis-trans isomerase n=1 Tax=Neptunitalea chrysea TaxID=1647581 RepID=A0A9W6B324_9FLAO|nr:peptidylprolyl isomerase [Neptunitalea chrysea]GLB51631.1 hypothetical protein NBRC110019_06700 [Neptunitalea chrysea]